MATLWGSICTILGYFSFQHLVTLNLFSRMQRSKENFFLDGVFCQVVFMTSLTLLPPGWRLTGFKWGGGGTRGRRGRKRRGSGFRKEFRCFLSFKTWLLPTTLNDPKTAFHRFSQFCRLPVSDVSIVCSPPTNMYQERSYLVYLNGKIVPSILI